MRRSDGGWVGPVRVADLIAEDKLLRAYCRRCGHERDLDPGELRLPPSLAVPDVGAKLVCSQCGGRNVTTSGKR